MAPRKPWVGGNWKCNGTVEANSALVESFNKSGFAKENVDVVIFPSTIHAAQLKEKMGSSICVGIQNISKTGNGAFTGETSVAMVKDFGLKNVLIGHSERRQYYGETDAIVAEKVAMAQSEKDIIAIICIGETLEEREKGITNDVVSKQVKAFLPKITDWSRVVFAYEPVWAIGTGKVSTPEQAQEVHAEIRTMLTKEVSSDVAAALRITYGGSVNDQNCGQLIGQEDIDGFLVGGASLKSSFVTIIETVEKHFVDSK